jgi:hypothetical protein
MTSGRPKNRGFTLVELMASMAVGMVVLLAAVALLRSTGDGYERVGGGIGAEREARALITQLTADLSSAQWGPEVLFKQTDAAWPADRLGFFTLQAPDAQSADGRIGDLCVVHYYVKDLQIANKTVRCLMRGFRESAETFEAIRGGDTSSLFTELDRDEPVAFNVVSFEARPKKRDGSGQISDWSVSPIAPDLFDVRLVIARRDLAGKFLTAADWDGEGKAAKLLGPPLNAAENPGLEVYGALVRFGNPNASR